MKGNVELKTAWEFVENTGKSVFLTGKAGTGKTTFLKKEALYNQKILKLELFLLHQSLPQLFYMAQQELVKQKCYVVLKNNAQRLQM